MRKTLLPFALALLLAGLLPAAEPPAEPSPRLTRGRIEAASVGAGLEAALRREGARSKDPAWVAWSVPMLPGQGYACCLGRDWKPATCQIESKNQSWGTSSETQHLVQPDQKLFVLLRLQGAKVDRVRMVSENCPLDPGGRRFVWLGPVKPEESVAVLREQARTRNDEEALAALAYHRNAAADPALETLASAPNPLDLREQALFWIGQTRGRRGVDFLTRVAKDDPDGEVRQHALFSLSQSEVPGAVDPILEAARSDRSAEIRGHALFCLSQTESPKAADAILEAIRTDPDPETRKEGVFALSQLPDGQGVPLLIRLGRESRDREIRKEAVFWLAESDHPEAQSFLDKLLD